MNINHQETRDAIRAELEATRIAFHYLPRFRKAICVGKAETQVGPMAKFSPHDLRIYYLEGFAPDGTFMGTFSHMNFQNLRLDPKCLRHTVQLG